MAATSIPPFLGAVLTGGSSTRMGCDKAFVEVGGVPMATRVAGALRDAGATAVLAVGGDLDGLRRLGFDGALPDRHPGEGPLDGLLTALAAAGGDRPGAAVPVDVVVVLACDLADARAGAIVEVVAALGDHEAAVPVTDRPEPLHAAWRVSRCARPLQDAYDRGERALHRALGTLDVVEVALSDPSVLRNVNRPADLPG